MGVHADVLLRVHLNEAHSQSLVTDMKLRQQPTLALLLLSVPAALSAQDADVLPFRAGQWGAEFIASGGFNGAGVLRFLAPGRALVLEGAASRSEIDYQRATDRTLTGIQLRLGHRWYRPAHARVVQSLTIGVSGQRSSERYDENLEVGELSARATSGGAFAEVGAAWMVAPQLSLGASWGGALQYVRSTSVIRPVPAPAQTETVRGRQLNATIGQLGLRVSLFF
jgi:hypothetical protein